MWKLPDEVRNINDISSNLDELFEDMPGYQEFSMGYYPPNLPETGKSAPEGHMLLSVTSRSPVTPKGKGRKDGLISSKF